MLKDISQTGKTIGLFVAILVGLLMFWKSGLLGVDEEYFRTLGYTPWLPVLMIVAMAGAWAFALPGSVFYFIVPLFYSPLPSTCIVTAGSILGALSGYIAARSLTADKLQRFKEHKVTRLLSRHSHFAGLFAIRVVPSSPHGFINYAAGLLHVPLGRFLFATALATAIKALVYSLAVHSAVGATSLSEALSWESVAALFGFAVLALGGRMLKQQWMTSEEKGWR